MTVTNLSNPLGVTRRRRHNAAGCADDRLEQERGNVFGTDPVDLCLELVAEEVDEFFGIAFSCGAVNIGCGKERAGQQAPFKLLAALRET